MKYRILAALQEHIDSGFVWVSHAKFKTRCFVRIRNLKTKKRIFTTAFSVDENFKNAYSKSKTIPISDSDPTIILNKWYRDNLDIIGTNCLADVEIKKASFLRALALCHFHPQFEIRLGIGLGIISVLLGLGSIALAIGQGGG